MTNKSVKVSISHRWDNGPRSFSLILNNNKWLITTVPNDWPRHESELIPTSNWFTVIFADSEGHHGRESTALTVILTKKHAKWLSIDPLSRLGWNPLSDRKIYVTYPISTTKQQLIITQVDLTQQPHFCSS